MKLVRLVAAKAATPLSAPVSPGCFYLKLPGKLNPTPLDSG